MFDQYLLSRAPDGSLLHVAHIVESGIELQGRVISLEKFQELLGPTPCVTFIDGRVANPSSISASIAAAAAATAAANNAAHQQPLLDDENDEFCLICSLGGDLICCETCPATFHTECIGLSEVPVDDWFCPACSSSARRLDGEGNGPRKKMNKKYPSPSPSELIPCSNYTSHRLSKEGDEQGVEKEAEQLINEDNGKAGVRNGGGNKLTLFKKLHLEDAGQLPPLHTIQHHQKQQVEIISSVQGEGQQPNNTTTNSGKLPPASTTLLEGEGKDDNEAQRQRYLAEFCALGEIPIAQVHVASKPLSVSFQLIHTAAVSAPSTSNLNSATKSLRGCGRPKNAPNTTSYNKLTNRIMPGYTEAQQDQLRQVLSAAMHLVRSTYAPIHDSRTGVDILPWLFRGKTFTKTEFTDYSKMHVAVLYVGSTIAGAACVRSLGNGIAEIPVFTVRHELQRNHLGEHFLSQIEKVLHQAGIELIMTPAMILPGWPLTPSSFPRDAEEQKNLQNIPLPMQFKWGYDLATKEDLQRIAKVRPLAFPGIYTCIKKLEAGAAEHGENSSSTILIPRNLPSSLAIAPEIHVDFLRNTGFIELRCDHGASDIVPMNPAPGYKLVIKTAAGTGGFDDVEDEYGNINGGFNRNQASIECAGSRGVGGRGRDEVPAVGQQQNEIDPEFAPTKRKYAKRKQLQTEEGNGNEAGGTTIARSIGKNVGRGNRGQRKTLNQQQPAPPQPPQVLQTQVIQPQQPFQSDFLPSGGYGRTTGPPLQYKYPPGAPVLRSLVHPDQLLPLDNTNMPHDLATIQQVQAAHAQQLAQVEDAIRHEQESLLQGMNKFRQQQQQLALREQQQQGQHLFAANNGQIPGYVVHPSQIGGGAAYQRQQQQPIYGGSVLGGDGGGNSGLYAQNQRHIQFQQQFDQLPPLQSIYENHQRLQQQQQQLQNSMAAVLQPPPQVTGTAPGGGVYYPASSQPQQYRQQFNFGTMPTAPLPSYYYRNGNGNDI